MDNRELIMQAAAALTAEGQREFWGVPLQARIEAQHGRYAMPHTTLYRTLDQLEAAGLLASRWESDAECPPTRPRRCLYRLLAAAGA